VHGALWPACRLRSPDAPRPYGYAYARAYIGECWQPSYGPDAATVASGRWWPGDKLGMAPALWLLGISPMFARFGQCLELKDLVGVPI